MHCKSKHQVYDYGALVTSDAITPTRSDSKILINVNLYMASSNGSGRFGYRVMRVPVGGSGYNSHTIWSQLRKRQLVRPIMTK